MKISLFASIFIVGFAIQTSLYAQESNKDSLLNVLPTLPEDTNKVKVLISLARIFYENADYNKSKEYVDKSLIISKKKYFQHGIIDYYSINGRIFKNRGKFVEAEYEYRKALALSKEISDSDKIASSYNNLGNLAVNMRNYEEARNYLDTSINIFSIIHDTKKLAYPLSNIGKLYLDKKMYDSALFYFNKTILLAKQHDDIYELAQSYKRMASIYVNMKDYKRAFEYCDSTLVISDKHKFRYIVADVYEIEAKLYLEKKDYQKSRQKLEQCLQLYHLLLVKPSIENCYRQLSYLDSIQGDYKSALKNYKLYHLYNDSLIDLENRIQFEKRITQYEADKQQILVKRKSDLLKIGMAFVFLVSIILFYFFKKSQLAKREMAIVNTKNRISRDLHDEIGSTLSSISMQTEVLKKRVRRSEPITDLIDNISITTKETINTMSDIVWSLNPENDSLSQLVQRLNTICAKMLSPNEISFFIEVDENINLKPLSSIYMKEIFMIAKEALSNCLKYAMANQLSIRFYEQNMHVVMQIKDNGIGFDLNQNKLSLGGEGLKNMRVRAEKIHATLTIESILNTGTQITLSIPF